jgi:flagellar hook assembly protein FlgD
MGMAGAVVAMPLGADSLIWNPAGLGGSKNAAVSAWGADGGSFAPQDLGGAVLLPAPDFGTLAVGFTDSRYTGAAPFDENLTLLGGSFEPVEGIRVGTTQKYLAANPGALRGWAMDLGLQAAMGSNVEVGFNAANAASSLVWANGLLENQPMTFQGGLAWQIFEGSWLALEDDWTDNGSQALSQWRAGLQSAWAGERFILRAGATQISGAPDLFYSGGLGTRWDFAGTRLGLDYAMLGASSSGGGVFSGLRQLLSLSLDFGYRAPAKTEARLSKILKDPRTNRVQFARIALSSQDGDQVSDWELKIQDSKGRVVRSFKGTGALPPSLAWDGRAEKGALVDGDGLSYSLRTSGPAGRVHESKAALAPAAGLAGVAGLGGSLAGLEEGGSDFALRTGASGAAAGPSRVKPRLRGNGQMELKGADFDLSDVSQAPVNNWELRIVDASGNTVKKFSGKGRPPKNLSWEGKNDLGDTVDSGLGASYVLRVEDESGKATVSGDDLVRDTDFSALVKDMPLGKKDKVEAAGSIESTVCERDFESGGWVCTVLFPDGESNLDSKVLSQVRDAADVARKSELPVLDIKGYADHGEGGRATREKLAQDRADNVLKAIMEGYEFKPDSVAAKGYGDAKPVSKTDPAANRRVLIMIHD